MRVRLVAVAVTVLIAGCTPQQLIDHYASPRCNARDEVCNAKKQIRDDRDTSSWKHPIRDMKSINDSSAPRVPMVDTSTPRPPIIP